jgi:hypothetical protein
MPKEEIEQIRSLLHEFDDMVEGMVVVRGLRRAMVRSLLPCDTLVFRDPFTVFVVVQRARSEVTSSRFFEAFPYPWDITYAMEVAQWDFGYEEPLAVTFPAELLAMEKGQYRPALEAVALAHVESEVQRVKRLMSMVTITPIFGAASYALDDKLCFVIMPFLPELTRVYEHIVKPTVEQAGLVCRRADDFKTNKAIIQDIWEAICEARIVIADLTGANPNVMYELGMAHTVGKETIMIYQIAGGEQLKFPFDIGHIKRIEYEDDAVGGKKLEQDLAETIRSILAPPALSK